MASGRRKGLPWLRLYTDTVDDEKLRLLAYEDRWHYVAILCLKGAGLLDAGDPDQMLHRKVAVKLGLQLRELEGVASRLADVGLVDAATFQPIDWNAQQYVSDTDPTATQRKRNQRDKQRKQNQGLTEVTDVSRVTVTDVTRTDTDTDTDPKTTTPDAAGMDWGFLRQLSDQERAVVVGHLKGVSASQQQDLLDELAGRWASASPRPLERPMSWFAEVAAKARRGEYTPDLALGVRAARQRQQAEAEAALQRRQAVSVAAARRSDPAEHARRQQKLRELRAELVTPGQSLDRPSSRS